MRARALVPVVGLAALAALASAAAGLSSSTPSPSRSAPSASAPSPGAPSASAQSLYEQGRKAVLEMRWKDATAAFDSLLDSHPGSSFSDGALYWRAFARTEAGDCASAYADLETLETRYPASPRAAAGHALRVRCAGVLLAARPDDPHRADYARLITEATQRDALPARLSAAEVLLSADPVEGARALRALADGLEDRTLLDVLLDRHFADSLAVARPADPAQPLGPANAVVLVRRPDGVDALSVAEALRAARQEAASPYTPRTRADIERALEGLRRASTRGPAVAGQERSRVVQAEDSEIHLYHGSEETVRIFVLSRQRGYRDDNIRVFVERAGRVAEISLKEAEKMAQAGDTRAMGAHALTFVGSSLALIRLDLESTTVLGGTS